VVTQAGAAPAAGERERRELLHGGLLPRHRHARACPRTRRPLLVGGRPRRRQRRGIAVSYTPALGAALEDQPPPAAPWPWPWFGLDRIS
jgi:hypothetical protein